MGEIKTLPISGGMRKPHSKKLEYALRDFLTSTGTSYYDDEMYVGIIKFYYKLECGKSTEIAITIGDEDYTCSIKLANKISHNINDAICFANQLNLSLSYGNFEITTNGDVVFKTYYKPTSVISYDLIDYMIHSALKTINNYSSSLDEYFK